MEKAEAGEDFVTLKVTYQCACEAKMTKKNRNQKRTRGAVAAEQKVKATAKR